MEERIANGEERSAAAAEPNVGLTGETEAYCRGCFYPLRGLTTPRCPECGRVFDPANPKTMHVGPPIGPWLRRLVRGPGILYHLIAVAAVAWLMYAASVPYVSTALLYGERAAIAWGGVWCARLSAALVAMIVCRRRSARRAWRWWRWPIAPAMTALTLALLKTDAPLRVRFALARPAFDRLVAQLSQPGVGRARDIWLDTFHVGSARIVRHGEALCIVDGTPGTDAELGFFVYSPTLDLRKSTHWPGARVRNLGSGWYAIGLDPRPMLNDPHTIIN